MRVSYGPPGHKGVTHLVAVGDAVAPTPTDTLVQKGLWLGLGAAVLGMLVDSSLLRGMGAGAAVACGAVRYVSGAASSAPIAITTAPAASSPPALPAATADYVQSHDGGGWY